MKFCTTGKGVIREFYWEKPGEIFNINEPEPVEEDFITEEEFKEITKADFYYFYWTDSKTQTETPVFLNSKKIGNFKINFSYSPWWNQYKIEIDPKFFPVIMAENEVIVKNTNKSIFGVAQCLLHISTKNGKNYSSSVSEYAYLSCKAENTGALPDSGILKTVNLGEDLYPVKLQFNIK